MRLTLRTLLAYLDGILEPNDAQDLGKKIEDSEFATDLVHRIRDVMRRLRLSAPDVADHSLRLDPNTVAEYLDNTLDAEGVTEFEKVCLESDVSLAEVASCHQILTLVLGEPAEIDPTTRQRMYQVPEPQVSLAPPVVPTADAPFVTTSVVLPPSLDLGLGDGQRGERKARPRPTVPEYLREPRKSRHWFPVAATLVVAVSMLMVVLNLFGQFEPGTPLGDMLVRWGVVETPRELAAQPEGKARGVGEERARHDRVAAATSPPNNRRRKRQQKKQRKKNPAKQSLSQRPRSRQDAGDAAGCRAGKRAGQDAGRGDGGQARDTGKESTAGPAKEPTKMPAARNGCQARARSLRRQVPQKRSLRPLRRVPSPTRPPGRSRRPKPPAKPHPRRRPSPSHRCRPI